MHIEYSVAQATVVQLRIYEPPRFYEAFLRGRAWTEPPDITARICGICPVAYQIELLRRDRGCLRRHGSRGDPTDAAAAVLRGVDRKPCAAHLPAARPDFLGYDGRSRWPRTTRRWSSAGCG